MNTKKMLSVLACGFVLASCGQRTMQTTPVRHNVSETVFASGVLEAKDSYRLTAQVEGFLSKVYFDEGDSIASGMVLAEIDNKENSANSTSAQNLFVSAQRNALPDAPLLQQAKNAVQIAALKLSQDSVQLERYQKLLVAKSIAPIEYENALLAYTTSKATYHTANENLSYMSQQAQQQVVINRAQKEISAVHFSNNLVKAVVGGKVYAKYKQRGDYVRRGDVIATIGSADTIHARISIDESTIGKIHVGQKAVVQLNPVQHKKYSAVVSQIYPSFDETTQSFTGVLSFTDSLDFKLAGTQLQSNISVEDKMNALVIPREYLRFDGTVIEKGKKEPVKVTTGFLGSKWVEITSGLSENSIIVTEKPTNATGEMPEF